MRWWTRSARWSRRRSENKPGRSTAANLLDWSWRCLLLYKSRRFLDIMIKFKLKSRVANEKHDGETWLPLINHENKKRLMTLVIREQSKYLNKKMLRASRKTKTPSMMIQYGIEELSGHSLILLRPMTIFNSGKMTKYEMKRNTTKK